MPNRETWVCTHEETSDNWLCSCGYRLKSNDHPCYDPIIWCHDCGTEVRIGLDGQKKPTPFFVDGDNPKPPQGP